MSRDTEDKLQDLATYGVSFSKGGKRIDPRDVYISTEPEQEPVAWMWEDKRNDSNSWATVVSPAKPEKCEYHVRNIRPLYLAPPKREPLSEDKLDVLAEANITDEGIAGYYLGFRDAEKIHGIGGEE